MRTRMHRASLVLLAWCLLTVGPTSAAAAGPTTMLLLPNHQTRSGAPYVAGELLVRFDPSVVSASAEVEAHRRAKGRSVKRFAAIPGLELVEIPPDVSVEDAVAIYQSIPGVLFSEPNYIYRLASVPSDTLFGQQWALHNVGQSGGTSDADIDAPEAWDHQTGSADIAIAVVDTGVDYEHPDLASNMWVNADEIAGNGIDDDSNGFIDDVHGIDPADGDSDPLDANGHGTHVAGTVGAVGNNGLGVAGVNWDVSIMALKVFDSSGSAPTAGILAAWEYAHANGATVLNNSWGSGTYSSAMRDAIASYPDMLFVCAAGNGGDDPKGGDNDVVPYYPASYDLANILSVGATDHNDQPAVFSNYGPTSVDVFAPGVNIKSTALGERSLAIASDATVNQVLLDPFSSLAAWQLYKDAVRPFEPMWALKSTYLTSAPSSVGVTNYVNDQYALMLRSVPVDLSAYDHPALRFRVRLDTELDADYLLWGMSNAPFGVPGPTETATLGRISGYSGGQFIERLVDLQDYAGRDDIHLWLAFDADNSASSAQGYDGVWVDDFEVVDLDPGASGDTLVVTADYTDAYRYMDGTSMSSPHVAGIAGMLLSDHPALSVAEMKTAIMTSADPKAQLSGKCQSGARVNAHMVLAATNRAPVAVADSYITRENTPVTTSAPGLLANDSDADGDGMTALRVSGTSHGAVTINANGSFTYTPAADWFGTDSFTYQASDGMSNSLPATVTITVTDRIPVYRFYNFVNNTHFFTPSEDERQMILVTWPDIFELNGVAYFIDPERNHDPLHRFYNKVSRSHFYTASDDEKDGILANLSHVFDYDGPTYSVNLAPVPGSLPVHRFFNLRNGSHFYTVSDNERRSVQQSLAHTYEYEGVAFWVVQ